MDTADLSLEQFLIRELQCAPVEKGVVSLGELLAWQKNLPRDIPADKREQISSLNFTPENYSHIRLRLNGDTPFEIVREIVKRYYQEAGYDITDCDDSDQKLLFEATSGADRVEVSCRINDGDVLDILVA